MSWLEQRTLTARHVRCFLLPLAENSLVPLYRQVMDGLSADIENGTYPVGSRIPSEMELSEIYGVSRITVRRAVTELSSEGILTKKQGKGTFVNSPKLSTKLYQSCIADTFQAMCDRAGRKSSFSLIGREVISRDDSAESGFFSPTGCDRLVHLMRVLHVDDVPLALDSSLLPYDEFAYMMDVDMTRKSLFEVLAERGARTRGKETFTKIDLVRATRDVASHLSIPEGEPLWLRVRHAVDDDGVPLYASKCHIVGSLYSIGIQG